MTMGVEKMTAEKLAKNAFCCKCFCDNCPFIPRHEGGFNLDEAWIRFNQENSKLSYAEYIDYIKRSDL